MSSSDRITQSKGDPEELSLPARTRQRRKSPNRETQLDIDQQPTGFADGLDQLQQEAVVHVSPLPVQPPRPTSSQSITGPITGGRPCPRALSVAGTDEGQPQSTPPLADHHKQPLISTNLVSPSTRADMPQAPFQKLSQKSGSHWSQLSALFTEDRYSTSTNNDQESCDVEVRKITRWQTPSQATTVVMSPKRPASTPSMVDYSTQGDPNQIAPQGNHKYTHNNPTTAIQNTNNHFIPDGSDRHIHDIQDKILHIGTLENDIMLIWWNFQT